MKRQELKERKQKAPRRPTRVLTAFAFACGKNVFQKQLWPQMSTDPSGSALQGRAVLEGKHSREFRGTRAPMADTCILL